MLGEYKQRIESYLELYKNTKVEYLRALQSLKYYNERAKNREKHFKELLIKEGIRKKLSEVKFSYCVSSPRSREN